METIAHELTHIWQFANWNRKEMSRRYGSNRDMVYEGMAEWAAIQFLYLIGETALSLIHISPTPGSASRPPTSSPRTTKRTAPIWTPNSLAMSTRP